MTSAANEFDIEALASDGTDDSDLVKTLRAALKAQSKINKELSTENTQFKSQSRAVSLVEALKSKGVADEKAAKVAKLYPADSDASTEAVAKWLDEYADAFGIETKTDTTATPEAQAAIQQFGQAVQSAPQAPAFDQEAFVREFRSVADGEALAAAMARTGIKVEVTK